MDESFKQLIGEVREPLPQATGRVERNDSANVPNGVANLFLDFEPQAGWREVKLLVCGAATPGQGLDGGQDSEGLSRVEFFSGGPEEEAPDAVDVLADEFASSAGLDLLQVDRSTSDQSVFIFGDRDLLSPGSLVSVKGTQLWRCFLCAPLA